MRWAAGAARLAARVASAAETRRAPVVVFALALAFWWLEAIVIPLGPGRDIGTYLGAYAQLFHSDPIDLGYVLGRTPVAAVVVGGLLDLAGGAFAEPVVSLLYAASITAWFVAARSFGGRAAALTALGLVAYPGYGILFHELSSDAVFAAAFAGWSLLVVRVLLAPSVAGLALVGAGVGVLTLIRPGNQVLLVLVLVPLLLPVSWRTRALGALAFIVPAVLLIAGWTVHNGARYGDYTLVRGGNATVPFSRAFLTDRIVRPDNGPASRELAEVVQRKLLREEPYRSYGIDLDEFFEKPTPRLHEDLVALSNEVWGWQSDGSKLREVGVEAVRTHPLTYARGVTKTVWDLLRQPLFRQLGSSGGDEQSSGAGSSGGESPAEEDTIVVDSRRLPRPTEGELIPAAHEGGVTTPDRSIYTVWTSPTEHHLVFVHPGDEQRLERLHERMGELGANLPDRNGNAELALRLNQLSRWYVPPVLWLAIGLVALVWRRPAGALALAMPALAGLCVVVVSALGLPAVPHYSVPAAPAYVLLAAGALLGPTGSRARSR